MLTTQEQDALAREHLHFCTRYLGKRLGERGREIAGSALFSALQVFDPGRGVPFPDYLGSVLPRLAMGLLTQENNPRHAPNATSIDDTNGDNDPLLSELEAPEDETEFRGLAKQLLAIERLHPDVRGRLRAKFLGDFSAATLSRIHTIEWHDLSDVLDCLLLAGINLHANSTDAAPRIAAKRFVGSWPVLAWLLLMLERHQVPMHLAIVAAPYSIMYRSHTQAMARGTYRRWYDRGVATIPTTMAMTENHAACWLLSSVVRSRVYYHQRNARVGRLLTPCAPLIPSRDLQRRITELADITGIAGKPSRSDALTRIQFDPAQRPALEAWLEKRIPRPVWDGR